ncbi:TonB-dependent receptor domain-containing protein [Sphingomonas sp. Leaf343]|uniref:TonB-dependent receptor domain-containing protein n=1 Tax=Sphingomonas sp. Leaf343 TaxID=1736345 RepID=UPI0006FCFA93|nr:TonB-dependent receptor [Sphingomonas sp. Leaf343]
MNRVQLAAGVATIAFMTGIPSTAAIAQTAGATSASMKADKATARKQAAADRRKARRQRREVRASQSAARAAARNSGVNETGEPANDIVVTGTRIAGNYGRTGAPVQTVGRSELQRRGLAHLEEALNSLPAVQPGLGNQTRNTNNDPASFGRSPINLRNLGSSRTLVLVNGQRATNDTNNIPAAMLERVEVLTGGASAVYGSDAVGGVVNYILKRNYTGITLDGEGSFFQHRNDSTEMQSLIAANRLNLPPRNFIGGPQGFVNGSTGFNFDGNRGNITAHAGYRITTDLASNKFDTTACALANGPSDSALPGTFNDRSQRFCVNPGTYNPYGVFGILAKDPKQPGGPTDGGNFSNAIDGSKRFRIATNTDDILTQSQDFIYRSDKRFDWGVNGRYMIEEGTQTEINATYSHSRFATSSRTRNFDAAYATEVDINCDNPYLSNQQATSLCGTKAGDPNTSGKFGFVAYWPSDVDRVYDFTLKEGRMTVQLKGKLTNDIRYETNIIRTDRTDHSVFNSFFSARRLANGLRARTINGQVVCLTPVPAEVTDDVGLNQRNLADDKACQPLDIFSTNGPNEAGFDYLTQNPGSFEGHTVEAIVNGTISGALGAYGIRSPLAKNPVGFSVNVEARHAQFAQVSSGAVYGLPIDTDFREIDVSGEIAVPLIQDVPFIQYLQASGAYRRMDFRGATGSNWRAGVDYRVSDQFALRGSYSTSYRVDPYQTLSPNIIDTGQGFARLLDLCSPPGGTRPVVRRLTAAQCLAFGVSAPQYAALTNRTDCNEAGFCPGNILFGGNRNLKPEQGASITVGMTITPKIIPNFVFNVDYYRNKITQFISYVDPYISFIQCQAGISFYCTRYKRDATSGRIDAPGSYADGTPANFGSQINSGIDFNSDYRLITSDLLKHNLGEIALNFSGNLRLKNEQQKVPGTPSFDCTGYFGYGGKENCGSAANPRWRHTVRVVWALPWSNLALNALWRYTGAVRYAGLQSNPILSTPPTIDDIIISPKEAHLPSSSFFDVGATLKVSKSASMRLTINNILDTSPYLMVNNHGGWYNTQPLMYDVFGRRITIGINANF